jgi:hypothetical protein
MYTFTIITISIIIIIIIIIKYGSKKILNFEYVNK